MILSRKCVLLILTVHQICYVVVTVPVRQSMAIQLQTLSLIRVRLS